MQKSTEVMNFFTLTGKKNHFLSTRARVLPGFTQRSPPGTAGRGVEATLAEISVPVLTVRLLKQTTVGGVIIGPLMNGQLTSHPYPLTHPNPNPAYRDHHVLAISICGLRESVRPVYRHAAAAAAAAAADGFRFFDRLVREKRFTKTFRFAR